MRVERRSRAALLLLATALWLPGCATETGTAIDKKATQGAILGGLGGAAAGRAIAGHEDAATGILLGAALGALTGGLIGAYLDRQAEEFVEIEDATVVRNEESLLISLPGDVLFESDSANLSPGAFDRLYQVADVLVEYPDSLVEVRGHTDAVGAVAYNQELSERRADSVRRYLVSQGVAPGRISAVGLGESYPVASNESEAGRQLNRRVELEVRPDADLRARHASDTSDTGADQPPGGY